MIGHWINMISAKYLISHELLKCSGMPECKLGLNDRVLLEAQGRTTKGKAIDLDDIKFHQYVLIYEFLSCTLRILLSFMNLLISLSPSDVCVWPALKMTEQYPLYHQTEHSTS